jgi:glycosyltransferase involved in cell wall biosynthesis
VSVKPGLGYDFAYPTKVIAALACGTPVVYAGPGPAASDLAEQGLGEAVPYDVRAVAAAMVRVLRAGPDAAARQRRVDWVTANRSLERTGREAAAVVLR